MPRAGYVEPPGFINPRVESNRPAIRYRGFSFAVSGGVRFFARRVNGNR